MIDGSEGTLEVMALALWQQQLGSSRGVPRISGTQETPADLSRSPSPAGLGELQESPQQGAPRMYKSMYYVWILYMYLQIFAAGVAAQSYLP